MIVLLRFVSIVFFIIALVRIWRYLVKHKVALSGDKCRGAASLGIHTLIAIIFFWTQIFTLYQMYLSYHDKDYN